MEFTLERKIQLIKESENVLKPTQKCLSEMFGVGPISTTEETIDKHLSNKRQCVLESFFTPIEHFSWRPSTEDREGQYVYIMWTFIYFKKLLAYKHHIRSTNIQLAYALWYKDILKMFKLPAKSIYVLNKLWYLCSQLLYISEQVNKTS